MPLSGEYSDMPDRSSLSNKIFIHPEAKSATKIRPLTHLEECLS